ncbi:GNAT family N-acetyltransferase [Pseudolabrys sp.]|uniref:GNAT family N-acetyltransferase n=1 Tax=Pseudolabrys sp. TaxID=1960880 RepID=UPI003D0BD775
MDGDDEIVAEDLAMLHQFTFGDTAPMPNFSVGEWWLATCGDTPVGFAGMQKSTVVPNAGYFSRVGVLKSHRGRNLQARFMQALERRARVHGWRCMISDTTENPPSANCFIRMGWKTFDPKVRWSFPSAIYWRKFLD